MYLKNISLILSVFFGFYVIFSFTQHSTPQAHPLLSLAIAFAAVFAMWFFGKRASGLLSSLGARLSTPDASHFLIGCILMGVAARCLWVSIFPTEAVSDLSTYFDLAERLSGGAAYDSPEGRAFWPPGLPLLLTPFFAIFGAANWVVALFNILFFIGTIVVTYSLGKRTLGIAATRFAVLIVCVWPNLIFMADKPHKELVLALLLPAALLFYLQNADAQHKGKNGRWANLVACGLCLGLAALTQPAAALFGVVLFVYELSSDARIATRARNLIIVATISILTVLPWTIRNYVVLDAFVPINTAGGVVFYSANNSSATGGWIPNDKYFDQELRDADEMELNSLAYNKAFAWIVGNKTQFVQLAILKQTRFLCCDNYGSFISFMHPRLTIAADPVVGRTTGIISNFVWISLALLIISASVVSRPGNGVHWRNYFTLVTTIFYFLLIFSLFQSESKAHVSVAVAIAIMAGSIFAREDQANPQGKKERGEIRTPDRKKLS